MGLPSELRTCARFGEPLVGGNGGIGLPSALSVSDEPILPFVGGSGGMGLPSARSSQAPTRCCDGMCCTC